jgi:hypothetical protein
MFMRQHSHSHAGGKCDHEAAGTGLRRRSPSPVARYAPIPTSEELVAMAQSIQNSKATEDSLRNQQDQVQPSRNFSRFISELCRIHRTANMTLYQAADKDTDTWGENTGDVPMKPIISCPNPQSSRQALDSSVKYGHGTSNMQPPNGDWDKVTFCTVVGGALFVWNDIPVLFRHADDAAVQIYQSLHECCMYGLVGKAEELVNDGKFTVNSPDKDGNFPLHWAANGDHSPVIKVQH